MSNSATPAGLSRDFEFERKPWGEAWDEPWFSKFLAKVNLKHQRPGPLQGDEIVPLIIGVTGHRDLRAEELPALKQALNTVFADLQALCPHSPLMLLSPLAEGADRLAAECFLDRPGARLAAPLPLELDSYRQTFDQGGGDFDRLLLQAEQVFLIPYPDGFSPAEKPDYRRAPYCYQALGAYIAEHCHILVALWDQAAPDKAGGSAEVIKYQLTGRGLLNGGLEEEFEPHSGRLVIHIQTGRQSAGPGGPASEIPPGSIGLLIPKSNPEAQSRFHLAAGRLDRFNRGRPQSADRRHSSHLWPEEREKELGPAEKRVQRIQAKAETLAGYWASKLRRRLIALFAGGWLTLFGFQAYRILHGLDHDFPAWPLILVCGLAAVLVLLGYAQAQWGNWQNRHLSYRALAEALRVQFYWRLLGVKGSAARESFVGDGLADYGETAWMRLVLAYTEMPGESGIVAPDKRPESGRLARDLWLSGQENFFRHRQQEAQRKKGLCLWPAIVFLSLGSIWFIFGKFLREMEPDSRSVLLVFLSLIMLGAALEAYHRLSGQVGEHKKWLGLILAAASILSAGFVFPLVPLSPPLSLFLSSVGLLLLGSGGFLLAFLKLAGHADNADRYKESEFLFRRAGELLLQGRQESEVLAILGRKALAENCVWLRQHLERPINLPLS